MNKSGNHLFRVLTGVLGMLAVLLIEPLKAQEQHFQIHPNKEEPFPFHVQVIYQDHLGYIWLGTNDGLFRYDGIDAIRVLADSQQIGDPVTALFEDDEDVLWVGHQSGTLCHRVGNGTEDILPIPGDSIHEPITGIYCDSQWTYVATYGQGLIKFNGETVYHYLTGEGLPDNFIYEILPDGRKGLWLGTDRGLVHWHFQESNFEVYTTGDGLPDNLIMSLHRQVDGQLVLGTQDGGFCLFDPEKRTVNVPLGKHEWSHGAIVEIESFPDGTIWLGTSGEGVYTWNARQPGIVAPLLGFDKLHNSKVYAILKDHQENIWMGTNMAGLLTTNHRVMYLSPERWPEAGGVLAIHADHTGIIWYSNGDGLYSYDPRKPWTNRITFHGIARADHNELIISIYEEDNGLLWLGTFGQGIYIFNPKNGLNWKVTEANGLINNNVLSISGFDNQIWLATLGGVSKCIVPDQLTNPSQLSFMNYDEQDGLGTNYIYEVYIDSKHREWFATDGKGVTMLDNGTFTTFDKDDGLESEVVYCITEDGEGNIWICTLNAGLYRYDGREFVHYSREDGLRDLNITAMETDNQGNLLVVHSLGVDIIFTETSHVQALSKQLGIPPMDANLNVISKDQYGQVWIGAQEGILKIIGPESNKEIRARPIIESIRVYLDELAKKGQTIFPFSHNHLSFSYIGLYYLDPAQVTYQHILEGYDIDWITSKERISIYPKLSPGSYTFKVRASVDGNFTDVPLESFSFKIKPPWWQTPWFILLFGLFLFSVLYLYVRGRERRLARLERLERDKIAFQFQTLRSQVNPHFLFNSFNTLLNIIDEDQKAASKFVEKLSDFFRDMLAFRDKEVIEMIEELRILENYYYLQQFRFGKSFTLELSIPEPEQYVIPPLTLQLLVENAAKHNIISKIRPLLVEIYVEGEDLIVRNNLQRKMESEQSTRVGLQNITTRYQLLTERKVAVSETKNHFIVKLPLIKTQS